MTTAQRVKLAPSILSADFARLGEQVSEAVAAGADYIHVDVMDGHFVPNITIGPLVVEAIRPITQPAGVLLDVHLMIERPERMIPAFAAAGAGNITVHVETCPDLRSTLRQIKDLGVRAGVTLKPETPLSAVETILLDVDLVLVMSVSPGFGNQAYLPSSTGRIARLRHVLDEGGLDQVEVEVDGGIKASNAAKAVRAGATVLVAGSAIFNKKASVAANMAAMLAAIRPFS